MKLKRISVLLFALVLTGILFNCPQAIDTGSLSPGLTAVPTAIPTAVPQAPGIPLVNVVPQTNDRKPAWTWSATAGDPATQFRYSLDNQTSWATVALSVLTYTPISDLPDGNHTLYVQAGNVVGWSASGSGTANIDTSRPASPTLALATASDNGIFDNDNITSLSAVTLSGTGLAQCTLILNIDGTDDPDTILTGTGNWTHDVTLAANATHTILARIVNALGNESFNSSALLVTVDQADPDAPSAPDLAADDDSPVTNNTDNITNLASALTFSGSAEKDARITLYEGSTVLGAAIADSGGSWTIDASLSDASSGNGTTYGVYAKAKDLAGNISADSAQLNVTIDKHAPSIPSGLDLDNADDTGAPGDNITGQQSGLSISGNTDANVSVELVSSLIGHLATIDSNISGFFTADVSLTNGIHDITAIATDAAGNSSSASTALTITENSIHPNVPTALDLAVGDDTGTRNDDNYTKKINETMTIGGHADANMTIKVYSDRETGSLGSTGSGMGDWSVVITLKHEGVHNVTATATDIASNTSDPSNPLVITIDSQAPASPVISDLANTDDTGISNIDNITNKISGLTFSGTAEPGVTIRLSSSIQGFRNAVDADSSTGNWTMSVDLNEGIHFLTATAVDLAGNESGPSGSFEVTIDKTAPSIPTSLSLDSTDDTGASDTDGITKNNTGLSIRGSEAEACTITLLSSMSGELGSFAVGGGSWSHDVDLVEESHLVYAFATDTAGNESNHSDSITVTVDRTDPAAGTGISFTNNNTGTSVTVNWGAGNDNTAGTITYKVVKASTSQAIDSVSEADAIIGLDLVSGWNAGTSANATGLASTDTYYFAVIIRDAAGNMALYAPDGVLIADVMPPTVTINRAGGQADPTNISTINFTVVFSESVSDFTSSDVTLGGSANPMGATVTGSGTTYNVAVSGMTGDGTVIPSLASGVAHDATGNGNTASTSTDNTVTYDTTPTTISGTTPSDGGFTSLNPQTVDLLWNEAVTGFDISDIGTLVNCSVGNFNQVSPSEYTFDLSGMTAGAFGFTIDPAAFNDLAGNAYDDGLTWSNTYVTAPPSVTSITPSSGGYATASPISMEVDWSQAVFGFDATDIGALDNCTISNWTAVSSTRYTFTLTPVAQGFFSFEIISGACQDGVGNSSVGPVDWNKTFDSVAPTIISISPASGGSYNDSPLTVTVTWSESVDNFTIGDIGSLTNCTVGNWNVVSGSQYTFDLTPSSQALTSFHIGAGAVNDSAGNSNAGSANWTGTYDPNKPNASISPATSGYATSSPVAMTVTWDKAVTGFTAADIGTLVNCGVSGFNAVSQFVYTFNLTPSGQGAFGFTIAAGACTDIPLINQSAGPYTWSRTYDSIAPTVTINQGSSQADPTKASPINFTVVFSEATTDFATGDVTIGGTAGGAKTATVTGSGTLYTVAVTGMTSKGTVIATIAAGVAHDAAGNASAASTSADNSVTWYNSVALLASKASTSTTNPSNIAVTKASGTNRILLVFANSRRTNATPSLVSSMTYGTQAMTKLSERTYNGASPTIVDSVWYLKETGVNAASTTSLAITWNNNPSSTRIWAVFLQNVDQTTSYANIQGGNSLGNVVTAAAVGTTFGDMGFFGVASIVSKRNGLYASLPAGFTMIAAYNSASFAAGYGYLAYNSITSFTPTATMTLVTASKQTIQGFVIHGY